MAPTEIHTSLYDVGMMHFRSPEDSLRFAARRNADALKQAGKGKLYKALDLLNEAILVAPNYPDSFWNRAAVFDSLGMIVQAESDRKRASELGYDQGTDLESGADKPVQRKESWRPRMKAPALKDELARKGLSSVLPTPIMLSLPSLSLGTIGRIGIGVAVLGAVAVAVVLVFLATEDEEDRVSEQGPIASQGTSFQARPTQTVVPAPIVTDPILPTAETPTMSSDPTLPASIGSPFTLESAQAIWGGAGISMEATLSDDLDDFSALAYDLELSRGVDFLMISALVYEDREGVADDWLVVPGQQPQAREGRSLPEHGSIWYNQNIVLVIRSGSATLRSDAFDSFISLDP